MEHGHLSQNPLLPPHLLETHCFVRSAGMGRLILHQSCEWAERETGGKAALNLDQGTKIEIPRALIPWDLTPAMLMAKFLGSKQAASAM